MIKFLKYLLLSLLGIILLAVLSGLILLGLEKKDLAYLKSTKGQGDYLVQGADILPMNQDTLLENHDLRIRQGQIVEIGKDLASEGETLIAAQGKYLVPGLIDMHVHLWDAYELGLYLRNGVTTLRNLWGHPMHLDLKEQLQDGEILGPNLYTSSPKLSGPAYVSADNKPVYTLKEAETLIKSYHAKGYDFIKTYHGMSDSVFDAVLFWADSLKMDIVAHPSGELPYARHFQSPVRSLEHAEEIVQQALAYDLDSQKLKEIVTLYSNHPEIALCPTQIVYYNIYNLIEDSVALEDPLMKAINPLIRATDSKAQWERWQNTKKQDPEIGAKIKKQHQFQIKAIKLIHESGGTLICGTDAGIGITKPGYAIHEELAFYQEAGLSNYECLRTATYQAAQTHQILKTYGSLELGKQADLLILNGNPLESLDKLKNIEALLVKGKLIKADQLEEMEEKALNRSNFIPTALRYAENLLLERY